MAVETAAPEERHDFQAEVSRLLEIVTHALYSDRRVFLRELISNASDACDRLRYQAIEQPELLAGDTELRVGLAIDREAGTLTIDDNGIGMSRAELTENLGTIARSGTAAFVKSLSGDARKDMPLIGQFGVGFYSAFMVADRVVVVSRRAGAGEAWRWESTGGGSFTLAPAERARRGTSIALHLKPDAKEFLDGEVLREIVRRYSDHIGLPIKLGGDKGETLNRASALWTRPKAEITAEQHREFYHHVSHLPDAPWLTMHWRAEGKIEYSALLYVPEAAPFDLYLPDRDHRVKLYVRRVFITDQCEGLSPRYLRFLRGVVDSEDLPLNVSREMLQNNPVVTLIRNGIVSRLLGDLARKAKDEPAEYAKFWDVFGPVLKEGLYEDHANRDKLLELARFAVSGRDGPISLADYVATMRPGQEAIYTISGEKEGLAASPQLEGYAKRGVGVLLLSDPIDEFWLGMVRDYQGKPFKSVTRGGADLAKIEAPANPAKPAEDAPDIAPLLALFRLALHDQVKDVRASERLTDSAVCLVADESDLDIHLERLLRQHRQIDKAAKRILEINPNHALTRRLLAAIGKDGAGARINDIALLLHDQARIVEGEKPSDPALFARRLTALLAEGGLP